MCVNKYDSKDKWGRNFHGHRYLVSSPSNCRVLLNIALKDIIFSLRIASLILLVCVRPGCISDMWLRVRWQWQGHVSWHNDSVGTSQGHSGRHMEAMSLWPSSYASQIGCSQINFGLLLGKKSWSPCSVYIYLLLHNNCRPWHTCLTMSFNLKRSVT